MERPLNKPLTTKGFWLNLQLCEGLDYQTELGDNYDMITVLPHTLIAENVFLVVRDRLNPNEGQVHRFWSLKIGIFFFH